MHINGAFFRALAILSWRYGYIIFNDLKAGRNPLRIYFKSYQMYRKHGMIGMFAMSNREYFLLRPQNSTISYYDWLKERETLVDKCDANTPLISIVTPVFNTNTKLFEEMIDSVRAQTFQSWELCIADDASTKQDMCDVIAKAARRDSRVRYICRKENGHISLATNSAIKEARGDWIVFLDHDDLLRKDALCEVASVINTHSDAGLIYSDEDKIDRYGFRYDPHLKPDWNPDLLRSQNYISHLCAIRRDLIESVGKVRAGFEGSQDYDLILRVSALLNDEQIHHIPKILYHWRAQSDSVAMESGAKPYAWEAGQKALQSYLDNVVPGAIAQKGEIIHTYRVKYPLPEHQKVSLIIPTRDGGNHLRDCVESIRRKTYYNNYEIIIVDNQSRDEKTLAYLQKLSTSPNIRVMKYNASFNFSAINNEAVKYAEGDIIGFINDDIEIINGGWLDELVRHAMRPEVGAVGAKLFYDNDTIQHGGVMVGVGGIAGHAHRSFPRASSGYFGRLKVIQNFSAVTAACMIVHRALFEAVGGFDEKNLSIAYNDVDLCLKLKQAGYYNVWSPYAQAYHHESISRGQEDTPEKRCRFESEAAYMSDTWHAILRNDPCYNPNLCRKRGDFSFREGEDE